MYNNVFFFRKMILHTRRLPQQAQWYMFAFDNNYFFVERLIKELSKFDSHLPIYTILRDFHADVNFNYCIIMRTQQNSPFFSNRRGNALHGDLKTLHPQTVGLVRYLPENPQIQMFSISFAVFVYFQAFFVLFWHIIECYVPFLMK